MVQVVVIGEGVVIRSKENTLAYVKMKIGEMYPVAKDVEMWLDQPHFLLNHKTPRQAIDAGQGLDVERLVEMMVNKA
jgi:hypothetical protein